MPLATALFDYELPPHLIAQTPAARRDQSRLLVVDRQARTIRHHRFAELPRFLRAGDTLFRNNAAVLPARLHALRPTGGSVECFLLRPADDVPTSEGGNAAPPSVRGEIWRCLVKPGRRLQVGATFAHPTGAFTGQVVAKDADATVLVRFSTPGNESIVAVANRIGEVPLPPYIERHEEGAPDGRATQRGHDLERYQTVYADRARQVAVAAPTAGLHFTPELIEKLREAGVHSADLTLHVGLGTFKPIATDTVEEHAIHRELYEVPWRTQQSLFARHSGRRIAVGTTAVRTIEDFLARHDAARPGETTVVAEAGLYVYPPWRFRGVDALITNFHQPRSTLLCLVAAFLAPESTDGIQWLREIYAEAIRQEYRFFSYGDAMLIL